MKPDRIFIVRHGESQGNVDRKIYEQVPDYALELTVQGREQARNVGKEIASIVEDGKIQFYVSPFFRTRQTYLGIMESFPKIKDKFEILSKLDYTSFKSCNYYEDARLREQEWPQRMESRADYKDTVEIERDSYGHFYYRFDTGESVSDVYDRISDFLNTLHRDFHKNDFPENVIIVTHGMTMRTIIMRWFHKSVEEFERWANPKNCEYFLLELEQNGKYTLKNDLKIHNLNHTFRFDWVKYKELSNI